MSGFRIAQVERAPDIDATVTLFREYAASLPIDLYYQDFDGEIADVTAKYGPPRGALLLARDAAGLPAGCVALRAFDAPDRCEMKRLYVAPHARGSGLGRSLALAVIREARARGYRELLLDTLPAMTAALALYAELGFKAIDAYYGGAPDGTVYLSLALDRAVELGA